MIGKQVLITLVVGLAAGRIAWKQAPLPWNHLQLIGVAMAIVGFILWTTARFQLGNSFAVTAQARTLITHGLYSKIRNPIYFFGSVFIAGYILLLDQPIWLLIFVLIIPLQIYRMGVESRVLEEKFGDEYRQYRAATWF